MTQETSTDLAQPTAKHETIDGKLYAELLRKEMLGFIFFKGKSAIIRLLRRLPKEKKKKNNKSQKRRNSLHQQEHFAGHEKYNCTLLLDQWGTRIHNPVRNKKGLRKVEPLTQIRINAIKVISKQVTGYY